jgi:hypothetical protein
MIVEHRTYTSSKAYFIPSSVKFHSLFHVLALYMYSNFTGVLLPSCRLQGPTAPVRERSSVAGISMIRKCGVR